MPASGFPKITSFVSCISIPAFGREHVAGTGELSEPERGRPSDSFRSKGCDPGRSRHHHVSQTMRAEDIPPLNCARDPRVHYQATERLTCDDLTGETARGKREAYSSRQKYDHFKKAYIRDLSVAQVWLKTKSRAKPQVALPKIPKNWYFPPLVCALQIEELKHDTSDSDLRIHHSFAALCRHSRTDTNQP